jgi:hypothetical protein
MLLPLEADGSIAWARLKHEIELLARRRSSHGSARTVHPWLLIIDATRQAKPGRELHRPD